MAKTKVNESAKGSIDDIFSQLIGQHNSVSPGSATLGTDMNSAVTTWIDSGSLLLNMILSNTPTGGWPCGRVVEVFGKESIGKSTLGYVAMTMTQRANGLVIFADIERAGNPKFMEMLGINLERIVITNEETIEKLFAALENNLQTIVNSGKFKNAPILIVVDSVTALQTDAELEGGYEYNMNVAMGKAKMLGKAIKKILPSLGRANACMYVVNQIRDNVSGYGPNFIVPGGKALPFYASIRLYLEGKEKITAKDPIIENEYQEAIAAWKAAGGNKSGLIKPDRPKMDETTIGFKIAAYTIKNKVAPPERRAHFNIVFSEGLDDVDCYLDYAIKYGIIKKSGAWNEIVGFENDCGKFYETQWREIISDADIYDKIREMLIKKLTIPLKVAGTNFVIQNEELDDTEKELIKNLKQQEEDILAAEINLNK